MAIRFPSIATAKQIPRRTKFSDSTNVPRGYLAVYVGESQKKRFVISMPFLNQPSFQELLRKTEEEFGFNHPKGGRTIPCGKDFFSDLTVGKF